MEASSTIKLGNDGAKEKGMITNEIILSMNVGPDSTVLFTYLCSRKGIGGIGPVYCKKQRRGWTRSV